MISPSSPNYKVTLTFLKKFKATTGYLENLIKQLNLIMIE